MYASSDCNTAIVTPEQYEAALAASKQVVWGGEGLPPVGVECERSWCGDKWLLSKIEFIGAENVVMRLATREASYRLDEVRFRPIPTEAERKREYATNAMSVYWRAKAGEESDGKLKSIYDIIYDAIAAGSIPGIQLTPQDKK